MTDASSISKQTAIGSGLIATAFFLLLYNVSDTIADLQTWHGLTTPAIIGAILKQAATVALSTLGGAMLPGIGTAASNVRTSTVTIESTTNAPKEPSHV